MHRIYVNMALFQIGWFVCIVAGNLPALLYSAFFLIVHGIFFLKSSRELYLIAVFSLVGCVVDSILVYTHFIETTTLLIPLWLLCLWVLFASTLCHSLYWLSKRLLLASILGCVLAPWSYWAGSELSPSVVSVSTQGLLLIAVLWSVILPLFLYLARIWVFKDVVSKLSIKKLGNGVFSVLTIVVGLFFFSHSSQVKASLLDEVNLLSLSNPVVIGSAYDLSKSELLYKEYHFRLDDFRQVIVYKNSNDEVFSIKKMDFSESFISPSFQHENNLAKEHAQVTWKDSRLDLRFSEKLELGKLVWDQASINSSAVVVDAGFDYYIRQRWSELLANRSLSYEFAVASRLTTLTMSLKKVSCKSLVVSSSTQNVCFVSAPKNPIFRLLTGSIYLVYDEQSKRLLRFRGLGNISNQQGKTLKVDINYEYL